MIAHSPADQNVIPERVVAEITYLRQRYLRTVWRFARYRVDHFDRGLAFSVAPVRSLTGVVDRIVLDYVAGLVIGTNELLCARVITIPVVVVENDSRAGIVESDIAADKRIFHALQQRESGEPVIICNVLEQHHVRDTTIELEPVPFVAVQQVSAECDVFTRRIPRAKVNPMRSGVVVECAVLDRNIDQPVESGKS